MTEALDGKTNSQTTAGGMVSEVEAQVSEAARRTAWL